MTYYLAYGSNLNVEQMTQRCPSAKIIGTAEIKDYELLFRGSVTGSHLTIARKKGGLVPAGVWDISGKDEETLDRYEGCPNFYYKTTMKVPITRLDGTAEEAECFIYIMHEYRDLGVPNKYYLHLCLDGYKYFGFPERLIYLAMEKSKQQ